VRQRLGSAFVFVRPIPSHADVGVEVNCQGLSMKHRMTGEIILNVAWPIDSGLKEEVNEMVLLTPSRFLRRISTFESRLCPCQPPSV